MHMQITSILLTERQTFKNIVYVVAEVVDAVVVCEGRVCVTHSVFSDQHGRVSVSILNMVQQLSNAPRNDP